MWLKTLTNFFISKRVSLFMYISNKNVKSLKQNKLNNLMLFMLSKPQQQKTLHATQIASWQSFHLMKSSFVRLHVTLLVKIESFMFVSSSQMAKMLFFHTNKRHCLEIIFFLPSTFLLLLYSMRLWVEWASETFPIVKSFNRSLSRLFQASNPFSVSLSNWIFLIKISLFFRFSVEAFFSSESEKQWKGNFLEFE